MKKSSLSKYLLFVGIATLATILIMIIHTSYANLINPINQVRTGTQIKPIDPDLDISVLDQIEKNTEYTESDLNLSDFGSPNQPLTVGTGQAASPPTTPSSQAESALISQPPRQP